MSKETFEECNKSMSKDSTDIETLQKKIDELEDAQAQHIEYVNGLHEKIRQKVSESWETFSRKEYTKLQAQLEKAEKVIELSDCDTYTALTAGGDSVFHSDTCRRCEYFKNKEAGE